ncbi:MAG: alpha-E domain-containing protein [Bryobacterales bacterium]|nr:alpha-E domain-containing protein [Bryobacterales bacterium]
MTRRPLLSRVADSVYWMGRYIERAENVARFVDVNLHLMLGGSGASIAEQWSPIIDTTGDSEEFERRYGEATRESVIEFLTFDPENPNSILSCLRAARENARTVRDTISSEMWEQSNKMYLAITDAGARDRAAHSAHDLFASIKLGSHLFQGITDSTMSHNEAWNFLRLGRMLERADKTSRMIDVKYFLLLPKVEDVGTSIDDVQWSAVLKSVSAFEMYRKRFGRIQPDRIAEFLLLDGEFARSVRHCLVESGVALHTITGTPLGGFTNPPEQHLGQLRAELNYASVGDIIAGGLHEFLDALQTKLNLIDESVHSTFFAMRPLSDAASA